MATQALKKVGHEFLREVPKKRTSAAGPLFSPSQALLSGFEGWLRAKGYKPRGIAEKLHAAACCLAYLAERRLAPAEVTVREAETYRDSLRIAGSGRAAYTAATVNVALSNLRTFYRYLTSSGVAMGNPFRAARRLREAQHLPRAVPTPQEMGKLLAALESGTSREELTLWVAVEILYGTGMRISELEALTVGDVREGALLIRDDKDRQDRLVPLPEIASELLTLYRRYLVPADRPLFARARPRAFGKWVGTRLESLSKSLSLPRFGCHSLRYACATHLFTAGADLRQVQALLGHRRLKTTEAYTRLAIEDLKSVLEAHHPRERITS